MIRRKHPAPACRARCSARRSDRWPSATPHHHWSVRFRSTSGRIRAAAHGGGINRSATSAQFASGGSRTQPNQRPDDTTLIRFVPIATSGAVALTSITALSLSAVLLSGVWHPGIALPIGFDIAIQLEDLGRDIIL